MHRQVLLKRKRQEEKREKEKVLEGEGRQ